MWPLECGSFNFIRHLFCAQNTNGAFKGFRVSSGSRLKIISIFFWNMGKKGRLPLAKGRFQYNILLLPLSKGRFQYYFPVSQGTIKKEKSFFRAFFFFLFFVD